MGTLYLVRHGQASLGAADYDQLSDLGRRQCERLGSWFRSHGVRFDAVLTGTLKRHAQSLAAIETGLGATHAAQAQRDGVRDLRQSGLVKVRSGATTLEEIIAATNE